MPVKLTLLFACVLALAVRPLRADDTNLVLRLFPISPEFIYPYEPENISNHDANTSGNIDKARKEPKEPVKDFLQKCGVTFPEGAYVMYDPRLSRLHHYNTEENQRLLGRLLATEIYQVQIDATFVNFSRGQIEKLARSSDSAAPATADLLKLWKSGKGVLLHTLKLTTRSGVNAEAKSVSEVIYPTDFQMPSPSNSPDAATSPLPIPDMFDTREVGAILQATPTVGPDGRTIDIVMVPEITAPPEWRTVTITGTDAGGRKLLLEVPQPVFHTRNIMTSIVLQDGETAVLGGMNSPKGEAVTYLFITATLIDSKGRRLSEYAGEPPAVINPLP